MENHLLEKLSDRFLNIPLSFVRNILNVANQKDMISFAGGLPKPSLFPVHQLKKSSEAVLSMNGKEILQYAGSMGYYPLREWIAERYSKKYQMDISPEMVLISNGSQQVIDILAKLFINSGDGVVLEKPSYLGAIQALSAYEPLFHGVDLDDDGANINQVEGLYQNSDIKLMYAVPNAQNPSGLTYSEEKRNELASLLKNYNQFLLEDDPYNEIYFDKAFPDPVKKLAPEHVAWSGSFSKMIAPGLRNGWVVLPKQLVPHFDKAKQATDLNPNNLTQYILHHYLMNSDIDEHLNKVRKSYSEQCLFMSEMIEKYFPKEIKCTQPSGGMFLWLTLPDNLDANDLVNNTMKKGVVFVPGNSFYTDGSGKQNIRMNFSNSDFENIEKGIGIMAGELRRLLLKTKVYAT